MPRSGSAIAVDDEERGVYKVGKQMTGEAAVNKKISNR